MDKTIKINLAGILFQIDEAAYHLLRDYLQAIDRHFHNVPGGNETIEDIESRIAEIFRTQQNTAGIISLENVETMIGIVGNPDDFDQPGNQQERPYVATARRRLYRNPDDQIISGVCGGIGAYVNFDPVWVRVIFILFAIFFGIGFFVYLALWISLPKASSDIQKKELYGSNYSYRTSGSDRSHNENGVAGIGNAFNEVFRALGKFFFILFRIILIIAGIVFVIVGFTSIVVVVMGFFFKYPGFISMGPLNANLFYLPDLLNCVVNPSLTPWIIVLAFIVIFLPLMALVYWGIKMIFWFRANDGVMSLAFLVIWVMSITALSIILFNQGVSFSQTGRSISQEIFKTNPDTLYIVTGKKVKDLPVRKEFSLPDNQYTVFMEDPSNKLSVNARLRLLVTNDKLAKVEIRKRSFGKTRFDAVKKAESLLYGYRISNDTLYLDEYFTIPDGNKWSADEMIVYLFLPEKTVLHFDNDSWNMLTDRISISKDHYDGSLENYIDINIESREPGNNYCIITENGLKEVERAKSKQK
jgi:phage shock protein PspC (stress-responsive transcriptional regulator)